MADKKPHNLPLIAITMGDPCGIGPEVIVKAFKSPGFSSGCIPFVVGDAAAISREIDLLKCALKVRPIKPADGLFEIPGGESSIPVFSPGSLSPGDLVYGRPTPAACSMTVACVEEAVKLVLARKADAVCTCPVNKARLHANGFSFPGHTEFIRDLTGAGEVVMMLAGPRLRVALATIHEPLASVPGLITAERLRTTIRITSEAMVCDFAIRSPRIAVAGLNPHAGEAGKFGTEELEIIAPAVKSFAADPRCRITGPLPPDTVFYRALAGEFDAVVAMYHDQGLIPVKLVHFNEAVNVSLGLPIVRTSVDHGTAYEIAGKGVADPGSLIAAVKLASQIAVNRAGK